MCFRYRPTLSRRPRRLALGRVACGGRLCTLAMLTKTPFGLDSDFCNECASSTEAVRRDIRKRSTRRAGKLVRQMDHQRDSLSFSLLHPSFAAIRLVRVAQRALSLPLAPPYFCLSRSCLALAKQLTEPNCVVCFYFVYSRLAHCSISSAIHSALPLLAPPAALDREGAPLAEGVFGAGSCGPGGRGAQPGRVAQWRAVRPKSPRERVKRVERKITPEKKATLQSIFGMRRAPSLLPDGRLRGDGAAHSGAWGGKTEGARGRKLCVLILGGKYKSPQEGATAFYK